MPVLAPGQQNDWNNNVYVLSTTRILVGFGAIYLLKSLYHIVQRLYSSHAVNPTVAAIATSGDVDLEDLVIGNQSALAVDTELDETLSVRAPQPSYNPQHRPSRPHPLPRQGVQTQEGPVPLSDRTGTRFEGLTIEEGSHTGDEVTTNLSV